MKRAAVLLVMILGMFFLSGCKSSEDTTEGMNISGIWQMTVNVEGVPFTANVTINGDLSEGTVNSEGFSTGSYMILNGNKITWDWTSSLSYEGYTGTIHSSKSMSGTAIIMKLETKEAVDATWTAKRM